MPKDRLPIEPNFANDVMHIPGTPPAGQKSASGSKKNIGSIILITVSVAIVVGVYFWYTLRVQPVVVLPEPTRPTAAENREPESTTAAAQAEAFGVVSTSNELDAIEADVLSTNLDSLNAELDIIDTEIKANSTSTVR